MADSQLEMQIEETENGSNGLKSRSKNKSGATAQSESHSPAKQAGGQVLRNKVEESKSSTEVIPKPKYQDKAKAQAPATAKAPALAKAKAKPTAKNNGEDEDDDDVNWETDDDDDNPGPVVERRYGSVFLFSSLFRPWILIFFFPPLPPRHVPKQVLDEGRGQEEEGLQAHDGEQHLKTVRKPRDDRGCLRRSCRAEQ